MTTIYFLNPNLNLNHHSKHFAFLRIDWETGTKVSAQKRSSVQQTPTTTKAMLSILFYTTHTYIYCSYETSRRPFMFCLNLIQPHNKGMTIDTLILNLS